MSVSTDLLVSGRVAQMGQGIMQDVATRMIAEMARNMEAMLTTGRAPDASDSVKAGSVAAAVASDRVRRLFGRGDDGASSLADGHPSEPSSRACATRVLPRTQRDGRDEPCTSPGCSARGSVSVTRHFQIAGRTVAGRDATV